MAMGFLSRKRRQEKLQRQNADPFPARRLVGTPSAPPAPPAPPTPTTPSHSECPICFESMTVTVAVVPCGHTLCGNCAAQVDAKCFTCNGPAKATMRVFV